MEVATFVQADDEQRLARKSGVLLLCFPFVVLTILVFIALVQFPPTWSLVQ